jgi:hypothetical protein
MKRAHVREANLRLGGIDAEVSECIHPDHVYRCRSKIAPNFQRLKSQDNFPIGFLVNGFGSKLVDVGFMA